MLWKISTLLVFLWLFSFVRHVGGWLIHPVLAVATIVFVMRFLMQHDSESSWA